MTSLIFLVPIALGLGAIALAAFFWSLRSGQYEDLQGAGERIFVDEDGDCAGSHHTLSDVPAPPAVEAAGHPPHDETPAGRGDRRPHFG